jgi:hypothetical protein
MPINGRSHIRIARQSRDLARPSASGPAGSG